MVMISFVEGASNCLKEILNNVVCSIVADWQFCSYSDLMMELWNISMHTYEMGEQTYASNIF